MPTAPKNGPLSVDELQSVWLSIVDPLFAKPFLEQPDSGFEAYQQMMAELARVSTAVDVTTQALFIHPWSGQSGEPAGGERLATVELTFARTKLIEHSLVLGTEILFEEVTQDAGIEGPVDVATGRLYHLVSELVMNPGEPGPFTAACVAAAPGPGYNNPMPGSISLVRQPGNRFANQQASAKVDSLDAVNRPDVPIPQHVGQYFRITAGINGGAVRRVAAYGPPDPDSNVGGVFYTDPLAAVRGAVTGTFDPNEPVLVIDSGTGTEYGRGAVLAVTGSNPRQIATLRLETGDAPAAADQVLGMVTGATLDIDSVLEPPHLTDTAGTEAWAILDWLTAFGLTVSNELSPSGGRLGMLDAIGAERKVRRAPGEDDEHYRERVGQVADTISPHAIVRAANRILAPYGITPCFREVGTPLLPGFYWDLDAWDNDFALRVEDRFHVWLDYNYFRGFFMIGVPALNWGDYGCAWDVGPHNAWDNAGNYEVAWDGHPYLAERLYQQVWQAVDAVRGAGVSWELYLERYGCF